MRFADRSRLLLPTLAWLALAAGCVGAPLPPRCATAEFRIDADFEGGAFHSCRVTADGVAVLTIRPEDPPPINVSPWYAFRLQRAEPGVTRVQLKFADGYARYWPKASSDGRYWRPLADSDAVRSDDGTTMDLSISSDGDPLFIAAQELLTKAYYDRWFDELDAHDEVTVATAGASVLGHPIEVARTAHRPNTVVLLGRQHPPEVTGAIAMRHFVAALLSDGALARRFRERFSLLIVPFINPDGVALGHWRNNVNGIDLNRDWGSFSQPETQSVAALLAEVEDRGARVRLMLDFHSTKSNLFYTQVPEDRARPPNFAGDWLSRSRSRLPDYDFTHEARPPSGLANTKNYFLQRYGIAAITYEIGDETPREQIVASAPVFAEEMMELLLEHDRQVGRP